MSNYIIYRCSVCRRTKDILRDDTRAVPNHCNITKGCLGSLLKIGETSSPTITAAQAGVVDWYPRGQNMVVDPLVVSNETVLMSCSSAGILTLAVKETEAFVTSNPTLKVELIQRKIDDISFTLYQFKVVDLTTDLLSGRDLSGRILRFNQQAIDEDRVFVRVNGVLSIIGTDFTLAPDTVNFTSILSINSTIEVSVYTASDTISRDLIFTSNHSITANVSSGAWGNIRWVQDSAGDKWWLYSSGGVVGLPASSRFKMFGIFRTNNIGVSAPSMFLFASSPFENVDRYMQFDISCVSLQEDFLLSTEAGVVNEMYADKAALAEIYPVLKLIYDTDLSNSSFVSNDVFTTTSTISTDTLATRLTGHKIIGPV